MIDIAPVHRDPAAGGAAVLVSCGEIPALRCRGCVRAGSHDLPVDGDADFFPPSRDSGEAFCGVEIDGAVADEFRNGCRGEGALDGGGVWEWDAGDAEEGVLG